MITLLTEEKMASRVGASILRAAGLPQCVCDTYVAYEELAVNLAEDSERLFAMRRHLESVRNNCAAYDTRR
jgi:protein O-GlcNAc transferase